MKAIKLTSAQKTTIAKLEKRGFYNLNMDGTSAIMYKGPSYDKSKAVIEKDGTFYVLG